MNYTTKNVAGLALCTWSVEDEHCGTDTSSGDSDVGRVNSECHIIIYFMIADHSDPLIHLKLGCRYEINKYKSNFDICDE